MAITSPRPADLARELLAWYDRHRRVLPWRALPGERPDPYRVWLSEVMLQQTTVAAVGPYFREFVRRWPTVDALAAAPLDDVLAAWAGLGYYARARNLHRCAAAIVRDHGGRFPDSEDGLRALPGIGAYTAAAIAAIAFDRPASPVDGNVERVVARLFAVEQPLPGAKPRLKALAVTLAPSERPGDFAQATMDLGATVCTPRRPRCLACPWAAACAARARGLAESLPAQSPKRARPVRRGHAFWAVTPDGRVLLRRRPESGLLGGMMEVPSGPWREAEAAADPSGDAPFAASWRPLPGIVRHGFTHFVLELTVHAAAVGEREVADGRWCPIKALGSAGLPTAMRKVAEHALGSAGLSAGNGASR